MIDKPGQISDQFGQRGVSRPNPSKSRPATRRAAILALAQQGCNIPNDIADELNIPRNVARAWVSKLVAKGHLKRTGRVMDSGSGPPSLCFEVAT